MQSTISTADRMGAERRPAPRAGREGDVFGGKGMPSYARSATIFKLSNRTRTTVGHRCVAPERRTPSSQVATSRQDRSFWHRVASSRDGPTPALLSSTPRDHGGLRRSGGCRTARLRYHGAGTAAARRQRRDPRGERGQTTRRRPHPSGASPRRAASLRDGRRPGEAGRVVSDRDREGRLGDATGQFHVEEMVEHPDFLKFDTTVVPPQIIKRIPPGPTNPLGERWIGFAHGDGWTIGIHGTPNPELVGRAVSHGCIRMRNCRRDPGLRPDPARDQGHRRALGSRVRASTRQPSAARHVETAILLVHAYHRFVPDACQGLRVAAGGHAGVTPHGLRATVQAATAFLISRRGASAAEAAEAEAGRRRWRDLFLRADEVADQQADQPSRYCAGCGTRGDVAVRDVGVVVPVDVVGTDAAADGARYCASECRHGQARRPVSWKVAQPLSATKTSTPPAVSLTNRLMTLSLSRLVQALCHRASQIARARVTSMLLPRPRCVNIQNARERPARVRDVCLSPAPARLPHPASSVQFRACGELSPSLSPGWKQLPWPRPSRCR